MSGKNIFLEFSIKVISYLNQVYFVVKIILQQNRLIHTCTNHRNEIWHWKHVSEPN